MFNFEVALPGRLRMKESDFRDRVVDVIEESPGLQGLGLGPCNLLLPSQVEYPYGIIQMPRMPRYYKFTLIMREHADAGLQFSWAFGDHTVSLLSLFSCFSQLH